jgi:hypothetical protein
MSERFHRAYYYGQRFANLVGYEGVLYVIPKGYVPPLHWQPIGGVIAPRATWC